MSDSSVTTCILVWDSVHLNLRWELRVIVMDVYLGEVVLVAQQLVDDVTVVFMVGVRSVHACCWSRTGGRRRVPWVRIRTYVKIIVPQQWNNACLVDVINFIFTFLLNQIHLYCVRCHSVFSNLLVTDNNFYSQTSWAIRSSQETLNALSEWLKSTTSRLQR